MELVVGRIGRPHGVRGEVTVEVRTDSPDRRFLLGAVLGTDPPRPGGLVVAGLRWHSGRLLVAFDGSHDRTSAEALRGLLLTVEVAADERPEDPEEYYDHQLVGLSAWTATAEVGHVTEVLHLPSQDLLVIGTADGGQVLVPFVSEIVPEVDLTAGRIRIDPPEGLLADLDPAAGGA
jgi:16S rRNA processing protein RimM